MDRDPHRMRRSLRALAAIGLLTLVACSGDTGTDPNAPFGGDYALKTVDGAPLPRTIYLSGGSLRLNGMVLSILQDSTYHLVADYSRIAYDGPIQNETAGRWTKEEDTGFVSLQDEAGLTWATGESAGNTLTLTRIDTPTGAELWVFRR
jgi:hypothetical protein